jgi:hypothetical protein
MRLLFGDMKIGNTTVLAEIAAINSDTLPAAINASHDV